MTTNHGVFIAALALATTLGAQAQAFGEHPAVSGHHNAGQHKAVQAIDPNTFIVAHPASVVFVGGHAGHEHPAVAAQHPIGPAPIDANTFLVQPPASTTWTTPSRAAALMAQGTTR